MATACDLLLTNAHILTMDERFTVYARGAIAISDGAIVAVGDTTGDYEPLETIDCKNRVVIVHPPLVRETAAKWGRDETPGLRRRRSPMHTRRHSRAR